MIVLEEVTKRFGAVTAVDRVSFRAEKSKFVVLLGPSGCGKSTLLRLIAGLEEVTEGKIFIEGRDVTALDPTKRRISMVFQSYALFPHLTVAENIVFGLKVRKLPARERHERLSRVAELVGLAKQLDRKPQQLSGGQRQRVAVARALVNKPSLILADEPTGNLHSSQGREIMELFKKLNGEGTTIIQVTHSEENAKCGNRIIELHDGWITGSEGAVKAE